jgi:hypothetical protein
MGAIVKFSPRRVGNIARWLRHLIWSHDRDYRHH